MSTIRCFYRIANSLLLIGLLLASIEVGAQQSHKRTLTLRASVYEKLEKASELIENKAYKKAKALIDRVGAMLGLNTFEKAQAANFLAFYYFEKKHYQQALKEYLKVVKTPDGLPSGLYKQTLYTIAQLYFQQEDFSNALIYAKRWFNSAEEPPADAYMLIGQAYYMLKDYSSAVVNVEKGIALYSQGNKKPKENGLLLLRAIYYELNDYQSMLAVVKQLALYYPKPQHLFSLSSIYGELKQEKKMLGVLEALHETGHLHENPKQLENLARLYLYNDIPIKAARLLEQSMVDNKIPSSEKNLLLLARALSSAQEHKKALIPLLAVTKKTGKAKHYLSLAQLYMAQTNWIKAEQSFIKALEKDKSSNNGAVLLQLGVSQLEQGKYNAAKSAFAQAVSDSVSRKAAQRWLHYINAEIKRIEALQLDNSIVHNS